MDLPLIGKLITGKREMINFITKKGGKYATLFVRMVQD